MRRCDEFEPQIEELLADEIDDADRDRLLAHAEQCASCREYVELHHRLLDPGPGRELPTEGQFAALRGAVLREIETSRGGSLRGLRGLFSGFTFRPVHATAFAASLLAVLVAGFLTGRVSSPELRAVELDSDLERLTREASYHSSLGDVEQSPYLYSNVTFDDLPDGRLSLSFDVSRHMEIDGHRDDPLVKEILVQSMLSPGPVGSRLAAIGYADRTEDSTIRDALVLTMLSDPNQAVRMRALEILSAERNDPRVQEALLAVLRGDDEVHMRLLAMDQLAASENGSETLDRVVDELSGAGDRALWLRAASYKREVDER